MNGVHIYKSYIIQENNRLFRKPPLLGPPVSLPDRSSWGLGEFLHFEILKLAAASAQLALDRRRASANQLGARWISGF